MGSSSSYSSGDDSNLDPDLGHNSGVEENDVESSEAGFVFTQDHFNNAYFYALKHFNNRNEGFEPIPSWMDRYLRTFPKMLRTQANQILNDAIVQAERFESHEQETSFKYYFVEKLNSAFQTSFHNTLCRPLRSDLGKLKPITFIQQHVQLGAEVLDLSHLEFTIRDLSDAELKALFLAIPHHVRTLDLSGCLCKPRDNNSLIRILAHLPPNVSTVKLNNNWHDVSLNNHTLKSSQELAQLAGNLPLTVKNVEITFPEGLSHRQNDFEKDRCLIMNQRRANVPASYRSIYRSHTREGQLEQAKALLDDYAKNDNILFLFFTCHAGRSKTREVAEVVNRINNSQHPRNIDSMEKLLVELKRIDPDNRSGSLARRTAFIEDHYSPELVELEQQPARRFCF
jgi:hypothetical protein